MNIETFSEYTFDEIALAKSFKTLLVIGSDGYDEATWRKKPITF